MTAGGGPGEALPWAAGPYSVKRYGVTITNCDSEPVQTPGCIQAHGALLVLRLADLAVIQASENTEALLGRAPQDVIGRPLAEVLGAEAQARVGTILRSEPTDRNPLFALTLEPLGDAGPLDVTIHTVDGVAVVELEATGRSLVDEPDYYALVKKSVARLQSAATLADFCRTLANEARMLSGHDRVMIYKFHADGHGEVFAESKRDDLPAWLGLHYPAEDIPKPAREIFRQVWSRPVADVSGALAELVPLADPDTGKPLTMTFCALRGPSVMYTEYLQNMKVTASLTMAVRQGDDLWGLIASHHYAGPKSVPYQVRAACEFLAQVASLLLKAVEDRENLTYRLRLEDVHNRLVVRAAQQGGIGAMVEGNPSLRDGLSASGVAVHHEGAWLTAGATPAESQINLLADWLFARHELASPTHPVFATDSLSLEYPPASGIADVASGILAISLSRTRRSIIIWFRPEVMQTIEWGGNPHEKPTVMGPHGPRLTPRASFELFRESVRCRSLPWLPVEVEAAARLRVLIMELVVGRAELLGELNAELTRTNEELDAFAYVASHDLKEPLRGIHKYAYQLLESAGHAEEAQRRKLESLMRLTVRMDSLLDSLLHFSRVGRGVLELEPTDLNEVLAEAIEMVDWRTREGQQEVVAPRALPTIRCDRVRVREVLVNLLSNGLKYNDKSQRRVQVGFILPDEGARGPGDEGALGETVYFVKDNGIGIHPNHFQQVFRMFKRLHGTDEHGGGTGAGLTIVKKLIELHRGRVWLDSTLGAGTTFYFTLAGEV